MQIAKPDPIPNTIPLTLTKLLKKRKGLLLFVIGGLVLLYTLWEIMDKNEKSQSVQQTLVSLCSHSPDDYWNLRTGLLQRYPIGSNADRLLVVAGKVMKTVMARDDFDLTRLDLSKGKRLKDTKRNAKHYIFQQDCQAQDGVSIAWRLSVLTTLGGDMVAITLTPLVPSEFYLDKRQFPNLDFARSNEETQSILRGILLRGMPRSEAIEVMKRLGERGRYGELVGPAYIGKGRTARYDYTFTRDIGVLPRVALEDVQIVIILELDETDRIIDVKVP